MEAKFKIYPEYKLIVLIDKPITDEKDHFFKISDTIRSDAQFDPSYNLLYDGRKTNWSKANSKDINDTIERMQDKPAMLSHCAYIIQNIGQMAYADIMFIRSRQYEVEYFTETSEACEYLQVPEDVMVF